MSRLRSAFGVYADQLQGIINTQLSQFNVAWYTRYFSFAPQQNTLTFVEAIGRDRIEAAASVVDRDSATPLRSRMGLEKLTGEIPAIKEMRKMTESDYRDFLTFNALQANGNLVNNGSARLLDLLFNDVKIVGNSAHKRLDIMCLEAVSTGKISLTTTNNPDGIVIDNAVDLFLKDANSKKAAVSWADRVNSTPLTDIEKTFYDANTRGIKFGKILMELSTFLNMKNSKEVKDTLAAFYYGPKAQGNVQAVTTPDRINEYLQSNLFPPIEVINMPIGIEKDGVITTFRPFNENNISFVPDGELGTIKNAVAIEEIQPVSDLRYATYNRALISKWSENEPFGEWTKVELNAFPTLSATIDGMYIMNVIY